VWKSFENSLTTLALCEKKSEDFVYGNTEQSAPSVTNILHLAWMNQINI
jgi:hypothetical protein